MNRVLGLLNLHNETNLGQMTSKRSLAALTFLGRYSFCDIPLSNFGNSKINSTAILVKKHFRSIIKHIDDNKSYTENSKLGSLYLLYNEQYANEELYNTDINNLIENEWILDENLYKYVVIAPTHMLYKLDFNKVIEKHIENNSEITACFKKVEDVNEFISCNAFHIDELHHLKGIYKNKGAEKSINLSMETYIINTSKLKEILRFAEKTSLFFHLNDIINYICSTLTIDTYEYNGFLRCIDSVEKYFKVSLELLDKEMLNTFYDDKWPIYTKTHNTPPARYLGDCSIKNSFVSNGAIIEGEVSNSIICRSVKIGKNCRIKNSIILSNSVISDNTILENVIVDRNAQVFYKKELIGELNKPIYIKQGDVV